MEFKARISYKVISSLMMALVLGIFVVFNGRNIPDSWNFIFILIALFLVLRLAFYGRYIYLFLNKKPALVVTESYIYDAVNDIRFNRDEIDTVFDDNGYLFLKLHNKEENSEDTPPQYKINLELININYDKVEEIIGSFDKRSQISEANPHSVKELSYKFKWGRKTLWFTFQFVFWCVFPFVSHFTERHKDYYLILFFLIMLSITVLPKTIRFLYFWIAGRTVLTANRSFIYDQFKNIKYYWNDIDEVVVTGDYMAVKLYHPEKYLDEVKNLIQRSFKKMRYDYFHKKPSYSINLDIVDVKAEDYQKFLNDLNAFSIAAES